MKYSGLCLSLLLSAASADGPFRNKKLVEPSGKKSNYKLFARDGHDVAAKAGKEDAKADKDQSKAFKEDAKADKESGTKVAESPVVGSKLFARDGHDVAAKAGKDTKTDKDQSDDKDQSSDKECGPGGMNTCPTEIAGEESGIQLLYREGIISEIPSQICEQNREVPEGETAKHGKNVILVVGDGMGWEMIRAGAVAKRVLDELEGMGIDVKTGAGDDTDLAEKAKAAFAGRTLDDYYTEGKGSGLSFQNLPEFHVMTTSTPIVGEPNDGNHYGPANSFLGSVSEHSNGMAPPLTGENGEVLVFDPRDVMEGGNMVLWHDDLGGHYPWDSDYFLQGDEQPSNPAFDPEYIMQHAIDSANSASAYATGVRVGVNALGVDLYERPVKSILQEALTCDKAGGVMTSVPILHATPAAFVAHTNYRNNGHQLQDGFKETLPTWAMGACASRYQPSEETKQSMVDGALSSMYTFLHQDPDVMAENFYDPIQDKNPDDGDKVLACFGGEYSASEQQNMPYRGLDSTYLARWCSSGSLEFDEDEVTPTGVTPESEICDHYPEEELKTIPVMKENVKEALAFLSKDKDGFFLMYEQGDIDWAAHANHLDDLLGAMLDIDEGVQEIMDWIDANGGYEKNALYVTADHDHYMTLLPHFPEVVANMIIDGISHNITPENNSNVNPWEKAIEAGRHEDESQSQTEHLNDFSTWTEDDIQNVAHFFGPPGSGGNGWGSHSTRNVVVYSGGDEECLDGLVGKGYRVLGRDVEGAPDKVDQVHLHHCMMRQLFAL